MLDFDYQRHHAYLIRRTKWAIRLPEHERHFFSITGDVAPTFSNLRRAIRRNVRTRALMLFQSSLPFLSRDHSPIGVYTTDMAKNGVGLISSQQLYPEEIVRLLLPKLWLTLKVARVHRKNDDCYVTGCELISRHAPDLQAFRLGEHFTAAPSV